MEDRIAPGLDDKLPCIAAPAEIAGSRPLQTAFSKALRLIYGGVKRANKKKRKATFRFPCFGPLFGIWAQAGKAEFQYPQAPE